MKKQKTSKSQDSPEPPEDLRASWAIGFAKASEITGIALQAILPALAGVWLDLKCGTLVLFFFLGLALGMTSAVVSLLRFIKKE